MLTHFLQGMLMGFYVAAPIGAVSIIYIRRALNNGLASGISSILGVTTAETIYAAATIYGLSFFSNFLLEWEREMKLCGAFFLLFIGAKSFFINPIKKQRILKKQSLVYDYFSTLLVGIINPIAIIAFVAIIASFGAKSLQSSTDSFAMLFGFALASTIFSLSLIAAALFLKNRFYSKDSQLIYALNQASGALIVMFALAIFTFSFL